MTTIERDNIRFTLQDRQRQGEPFWVFNARRISDDHSLPGQKLFSGDPSEFMTEMVDMWFAEHPDLSAEPAPVRCLACNEALVSDHDTNYQFDNALWIGFHGGYGMFVDACDFPLNTEDQWIRDDDGEYVLVDGKLQINPNYEPEYREERILPGRPDHEAVICHRCAHTLCDTVPWIGKLLEPRRSHAHRTATIPQLLADGHEGWDLDRHKETP